MATIQLFLGRAKDLSTPLQDGSSESGMWGYGMDRAGSG